MLKPGQDADEHWRRFKELLIRPCLASHKISENTQSYVGKGTWEVRSAMYSEPKDQAQPRFASTRM